MTGFIMWIAADYEKIHDAFRRRIAKLRLDALQNAAHARTPDIVANLQAACGLVVEIHDDHFARDEEDRVWLKAVGERGWVVLTKDQRLRYRPLEISALRASKARVFVLTAGNLRGVEIAAVFLAALPQIGRVLNSVPGPFVARVSQSAHVTVT
jgi:predicted nuclease of predicted toxin-antitoxin system